MPNKLEQGIILFICLLHMDICNYEFSEQSLYLNRYETVILMKATMLFDTMFPG